MANIKDKPKNTRKKENPIGVFDSGVGGLSVLTELKKILPNENFVFLADQKYVPYGEKSKKKLVNLACRVADFLIAKHDIKMLIVACNTATCNAIDELRARYDIPVIGTVPAVKVAGEGTKTGVVGVISTPSTSKSAALKTLIANYCKGVRVINVGAKGLENLVEKGDFSREATRSLLEKYLAKIKNSKADRLVLGCTHYPFLKENIGRFLGPRVKLLDSGKAIARHTKAVLGERRILGKRKGKIRYYTTGDPRRFERVASQLLGRKIKAEKVAI